MKITRAIGAMVVLTAMAACGGGGGGGDKAATPAPSAPPTTTPTTPTTPPGPLELRLAVSTPTISRQLSFGDDALTEVAGDWSATNLGSTQVYLQVSDNQSTFAMPATRTSTPGRFAFSLPLSNTVLPGSSSGIITVRACEDVQCTKPFANGMGTVAYTVDLARTQDWETTQATAAHNGYVAVTLDPAKFAKAWEWARPEVTTGALGPINPVATWERSVLVSEAFGTGGATVYALNETDGSMRWRRQFPPVTPTSYHPPLSPPAVTDGRVYITTTGQTEATFLYSLNVYTGDLLTKSPFRTQWAQLLAPTVKNGQSYVQAGTYGGVVYAFDAITGRELWQGGGGSAGLNTPSVDNEGRVYVHGGVSLNVMSEATGVPLATISSPPPDYPISQSDYHAVAALGLPDSITAPFSVVVPGGGGASSNSNFSRPLKNYSFSTASVRWTSVKSYGGYPAVAKGIVYATTNSAPRQLEAINERTGAVLWSWTPPGSESFYRNVVVTNNLLFVSTNRALYAIDLDTRKAVWESPTPGDVAISASRMIYVTTGASKSDGRVVAFRTR
ncbi:PQQ-binding-like beta-propeller repeat protein [Lysobacter soli]|uniref:outer membrane protein assembly factor BamB family protein n=1 Tax=Lysobacter soli TaxID=453783 RepID=UPI0012ECF0AD|nr:PQQ-binding-like beta-propeller repeat protein [Lysobacter soli]QGW63915.1 PQQ-binding-like beta-propeller repeat protein [Lysobacter soli]